MNNFDTLGSRIYFDANIYIYAFEGGYSYQSQLAQIFGYAERPDVQVIAGQILIPELLTKPFQDQNQTLYDKYWGFLTQTETIDLVPLNQDIYLSSVHFRGTYNLKTLDALHLATALAFDCSSFVTNDKKLSRITELSVIQLQDL